MFLFNDTATTESYTLSLHDALPILPLERRVDQVHDHRSRKPREQYLTLPARPPRAPHQVPSQEGGEARKGEEGYDRSEEHTSELQSRQYLVCRLLLEKKRRRPSARP